MFKVKIKKISSQEITHSGEWKTLELANEWIAKIESKSNNPWGKLERTIPSSDATPEEIASALKVIPAITEVIPAQEITNELGEVVIIPEEIRQVSPEMVRLPKTYEIIIEDISAEIQAEKDKDDERKALKQALKSIKDSDISTVAELRKVIKDLLKVLL